MIDDEGSAGDGPTTTSSDAAPDAAPDSAPDVAPDTAPDGAHPLRHAGWDDEWHATAVRHLPAGRLWRDGQRDGPVGELGRVLRVDRSTATVLLPGADLDRAALHHMQYGAAEGRVTSFDGLGYIASNPDLIRVLPHTVNAGAMHFVEVGAKAGRGVWFDPLRYIASNPDLTDAFGIDTVRGMRHYLEFGAFENRPYYQFNVQHYLETYEDLRAAFGTDTRAATVHWIETGADEGRSGFHYPPGWFHSGGVTLTGTITRLMDYAPIATDGVAASPSIPQEALIA